MTRNVIPDRFLRDRGVSWLVSLTHSLRYRLVMRVALWLVGCALGLSGAAWPRHEEGQVHVGCRCRGREVVRDTENRLPRMDKPTARIRLRDRQGQNCVRSPGIGLVRRSLVHVGSKAIFRFVLSTSWREKDVRDTEKNSPRTHTVTTVSHPCKDTTP